MTRDGTVGRSDATEPNLASHWDIDPVRMMRTRFAYPIRASSPPGLHQQAGHMTASDLCAARQMISCQAGAIHTRGVAIVPIDRIDGYFPRQPDRFRTIQILAKDESAGISHAADAQRMPKCTGVS